MKITVTVPPSIFSAIHGLVGTIDQAGNFFGIGRIKSNPDVTRKLEGHAGVDCAQFNHHAHPHALIVKYDPDAIEGMQILQIVRQYDTRAAMGGL